VLTFRLRLEPSSERSV